MLKVLGINSIYTLVYAGSGIPDIIRGFPSQQFNHAIICVPLETDTLWLECTSQTCPPGFLGYSLDDRTVLLVDKIGSRLTRTKRFEPDENIQWRKAVIEIDEQGLGAKAKIHTEYKGQQYNYVESLIHQSRDDQKKFLIKNIDIPQFTISNFSVINHYYNSEPTGLIDLDMDIHNYLSGNGDHTFLPLNLMNRYRSAPKPNKDRINDIFISTSYYDIDSVEYQLPGNMSVEFIPEGISLKEIFGEYSLRCERKDNSILVIREIKIRKGTYPKAIYPSFVAFYTEILKADRCIALLKSKDQNQEIVSK